MQQIKSHPLANDNVDLDDAGWRLEVLDFTIKHLNDVFEVVLFDNLFGESREVRGFNSEDFSCASLSCEDLKKAFI